MAVDKNLFLHDLAIVAIMKCEAPYLKEWLDYHLLAGVDHFYLYDNESPDNQAEVAKPYVEAGLVDYFFTPGKAVQMFAYLDAVKRFKFFSRYMAFIDGDEFLYPKINRSIAEVVDEILLQDKNAAGLAINWQIFGSDGAEEADYTRGVLERFMRRAPSDFDVNKHVKTIADPRKVSIILNPHFLNYFEGNYSVNENGGIVVGPFNEPVVAEKIVINHYHCKSWEEYGIKRGRGYAPVLIEEEHYTKELFQRHDRNDEFDDGILKYRATRAEKFILESNKHRLDRVIESLVDTLSKFNSDESVVDIETALTCRALSTYLREHFANDADYWKICEQESLKALSSLEKSTFTEARLLISELPDLLSLPYPVVEELRGACLQLIPQMMQVMRLNKNWLYYVELDYIQRLLKNFGK